ncbi:hypothetical protein RLW55_19475 [Hyphomicrobium sp. B1]|uniref:hypothetical protein n=1 Tax=Hyphomicrobium sp. B1 TaxID=3075651 RepID=UPI003C2C54CD
MKECFQGEPADWFYDQITQTVAGWKTLGISAVRNGNGLVISNSTHSVLVAFVLPSPESQFEPEVKVASETILAARNSPTAMNKLRSVVDQTRNKLHEIFEI